MGQAALAQETIAGAEIAAAGDAVPVTGAEADEAVARASAWLNGVTGLQGRFIQINPDDSTAEGDFYLQRPGKVRFAYDPPSALTIVSDGRDYAELDAELETVNRYALEETPLNTLLKADIDLAADTELCGVARQGDLVLICVNDSKDQLSGEMVLVFSDPEFALREWVAIDESKQQTRVILTQLTRQASLDPALFAIETIGSRRPGGR